MTKKDDDNTNDATPNQIAELFKHQKRIFEYADKIEDVAIDVTHSPLSAYVALTLVRDNVQEYLPAEALEKTSGGNLLTKAMHAMANGCFKRAIKLSGQLSEMDESDNKLRRLLLMVMKGEVQIMAVSMKDEKENRSDPVADTEVGAYPDIESLLKNVGEVGGSHGQ